MPVSACHGTSASTREVFTQSSRGAEKVPPAARELSSLGWHVLGYLHRHVGGRDIDWADLITHLGGADPRDRVRVASAVGELVRAGCLAVAVSAEQVR